MQQQRMQPGAARPPYLQAPNVTMNTMGPMGGGVQNQPAPPYRQTGGKPGPVGVGNVGAANVGLQPNQQFQQVRTFIFLLFIPYTELHTFPTPVPL